MKFSFSKAIDILIKYLLFVCILITLATTASVVFIICKEGFGFFEQVGVAEFLFGTKWEPLMEPKSFGVLPLVAGTLHIVIGSMVIAIPAGLLTAAYLSEFSSAKSRNTLKPILEILAGIPTVVYGFFALSFVTPILQKIFPETEVFNALSAAIVVGIMILPMFASLCDDAFRGIPLSLREAAYALGATKFEVIWQIVFSAAAARIGAAAILSISRAIGETMAVSLAAGASPNLTLNPLEGIQTMTSFIVQVALGDTPTGSIEYLSSYAVAILLFVITFIMNLVGSVILTRVRKEL